MPLEQIKNEADPHYDLQTRCLELFVRDGMSPREISIRLDVQEAVVDRVLAVCAADKHAELHTRTITQEVVRDKVPLLEEIVGLSLVTVRDFLVDLNNDPYKKKKLGVRDIKDIATIATDLNSFVRLELGKSTKNVAVAYTVQEAQELIAELASVDPLMSPQVTHAEVAMLDDKTNGSPD